MCSCSVTIIWLLSGHRKSLDGPIKDVNSRERITRVVHIYIYIYIIIIHRQICFVLSELISVARQDFPIAEIETLVDSNAKPKLITIQPQGAISCEANFKRLWITITIVYIHSFNGCRDLNSYTKRLAMNANEDQSLYIYIYNDCSWFNATKVNISKWIGLQLNLKLVFGFLFLVFCSADVSDFMTSSGDWLWLVFG